MQSERFKYLKHESNKGQTLSILEGLDNAEGEWMLFLDSDDFLEVDALASLVEVAKRDNANVVISNYKVLFDDGSVDLHNIDIPEGCYKKEDFVGLLYSKIPLNFLSCIGTKLYNMDFVKNKKPKTPSSLRTNYDIAYILDALTVSDHISYVNRVSYVYYRRSDSITHTYRNNMYRNLTDSRAKLLPLLQSCGCYESKKKEYHTTMYSIILGALTQEIKYSKGYSHYKEVFDAIQKDDNKKTFDVVLNSGMSKKDKFILKLIKNNHYVLFYVLLSLRHMI